MKFLQTPIAPLFGLFLFGSLASTSAQDERELMKFFETEIRPLLAAECYECHGPKKTKGGLRADHLSFLLEGGATGPALVAGSPEDSLLIKAIRRDDPDLEMPPKKALEPQQVAALEKWVALGAPWPEEVAARKETDEHGFTEADKQWWAIQPIKDSAPPEFGEGWAKNEVDRFIAEKLEQYNLKPAPPAKADELVRRIYFDLHGLPPTPVEVSTFEKAFAADPDKAVSDLVDTLLENPRYGERWGQHWLDVARYAESDGYRADGYRPEAWMYRDYVVRSFNEDKSYREFVREQLAADEFAPDDPEKVIATAFLRHGPYEWNQRNAEMQWEIILTEMTNVTAETFLALGMACAECHDHKFDPILQKDYFALQAFLNSTWWPENQALASPQERAEYDQKLAEWEKATASIRAELDELTAPIYARRKENTVKLFPDEVQAMYWKSPEERSAYEEQVSQLVQRQIDNDYRRTDFKSSFAKQKTNLERYLSLTEALKKFDSLKPAALPPAFITTDVGTVPAETKMQTRKGALVIEPAFLTLIGDDPPEITPTDRTTGRRTALANWIASEKNPLTARVMVNRVWQHHFAEGLVPTPNDFGVLGDSPSHPRLLDWLVHRFFDDDWKLKNLHRLIMTSATYQQTARREPTSDEELVDPSNRLLWRYPPQRLDAEEIRDAALVISGELRQRSGGPSIEGTTPERSVYMKKRRNSPDPMMGEFDSPAGFGSTPSRIQTTTPLQSLLLINSSWAVDRAKAFAKRLLETQDRFEAEHVREAYRIAYGREALSHEIEAALAFVQHQRGEVGGDQRDPEDKYPNETGLRPSTQFFSETAGIPVSENALWLQPGSRFESLRLDELTLPDYEFTIEAVSVLDVIHADASVNTLLSRYNGSNDEVGWSLGVTSAKSRFDPQNLILQIVGDDFQKNRNYEVVASGLKVPLGKPVYLAAAISARPSKKDLAKGTVTFYLKDLSDPKAELQQATVEHQTVSGLSVKDTIDTYLGGRAEKGHLWDGQVARLTVSEGVLRPEQLLVAPQLNEAESAVPAPRRVIDWDFAGKDGETPAPNTAWRRPIGKSAPTSTSPRLLEAVTDFCQALLNSNEFLYLH